MVLRLRPPRYPMILSNPGSVHIRKEMNSPGFQRTAIAVGIPLMKMLRRSADVFGEYITETSGFAHKLSETVF